MNHPKKRLDAVAEILMGQAPPGESYNLEGDGWPLLAGAGDFKGDHPVAKKFTTEPSKISMPGDIVIGVRASIGDKVVADQEYCLGRGVAALRARSELHDRYLWHWLSLIKPSLEAKGKGATFKQVTKEDIAELEIPLPPLEEQRRIAVILDKCNEMKEAARKRRETLGKFQASYFRLLFGDPTKSTENWSLKTIASCCISIQTGPFGSLLHQSDYIQGGIPILNPKHIVNGVVSCGENETIAVDKAVELSTYRLKEGDVLLARRGEMGRCAAITRRENGYLCGTGSMFLRPLRDALAPEYLAALLSTKHMRYRLERVAIGTTLLNLNSTIVGDILIPVPPIELQFRYARLLARLDVIGDISSQSGFACSALLASIQNSIFPIAGS